MKVLMIDFIEHYSRAQYRAICTKLSDKSCEKPLKTNQELTFLVLYVKADEFRGSPNIDALRQYNASGHNINGSRWKGQARSFC